MLKLDSRTFGVGLANSPRYMSGIVSRLAVFGEVIELFGVGLGLEIGVDKMGVCGDEQLEKGANWFGFVTSTDLLLCRLFNGCAAISLRSNCFLGVDGGQMLPF